MPAPDDKQSVQATDRVMQEVNDALTLVAFAVETGAQGADGKPISRADIAVINAVAAGLGRFRMSAAEAGSPPAPAGVPPDDRQSRTVSAGEWVDFQIAYYNVAKALAPINADTLHDTEGTSQSADRDPPARSAGGTLGSIAGMMLGYSPAQRFARGLAAATIVFALVILLSEWGLSLYAYDADESVHRWQRELLRLFVPWCYGGLGACVYLLKNAHAFIYARCFDLRRKPEYVNRIVLGTISGGAIMLFVKYLGGDDGTGVQLSAGALGFLAGYSTDFLFGTIERVIAAILPKGESDSSSADTPPPPRSPAAPGQPT